MFNCMQILMSVGKNLQTREVEIPWILIVCHDNKTFIQLKMYLSIKNCL